MFIFMFLFIYLFICTVKNKNKTKKQQNNNKREADCAGEIRKSLEAHKRISPQNELQKQIQNPTISRSTYK